MTEEATNAMIVLLATDALEAADHQAPIAAILLVDAALSILVSRIPNDGAREIADMLAGYLPKQIDAALARIGGAA